MAAVRLLSAAALALAVGLASEARAQDAAEPPAPKPAPSCVGTAITDPAGDNDAPLFTTGGYADITGAFFTYDEENESVKAHIQLAELDPDPAANAPIESTSTRWYLTYRVGEVRHWLSAAPTEVFQYGTMTGNTFTLVGDTKGKFFGGKPGVIQISVPAKAEGKLGARLATPWATFRAITLNVNVTQGYHDRAPDGTRVGEASTIVTCPALGPAPGSPPFAEPTPEPRRPARSSLPVASQTKTLSARRTSRRVGFNLLASEPVHSIRATFEREGVTVGFGRLAALDGEGRLSVKLRSRLKPGRYFLRVAGTHDGNRLERKLRIRVTR